MMLSGHDDSTTPDGKCCDPQNFRRWTPFVKKKFVKTEIYFSENYPEMKNERTGLLYVRPHTKMKPPNV